MSADRDSALADAAFHAHAHLDEPLSLDTLACVSGLSPHHFHRLFRAAFGETPTAYVERLRLERAAWRLQLHSDSILAIAIDCGFNDHETFSRAFRRRYGLSPRDYRRTGRFPGQARRERDQNADGGDFVLSPTRIRTLTGRTIAFIRQVGPYEEVDPNLWAELREWAGRRGLPPESALIGIGHDAPGITEPERLRFDAAVTVPADTEGDGRVRVADFPARRCAVTTHVGAYATLPAAYPTIFRQSLAVAPTLVALPAIEVYDDRTIVAERAVSRTEVHLPIDGL